MRMFVLTLVAGIGFVSSRAQAQTPPPPVVAPADPTAPQDPAPPAPPSAPAPQAYPPPPPPPPYYPPPGYPQYPPPGYPPPSYPPPGYPGYSYPPPPVFVDPGAHKHDGFFLRFDLGPGYTAMTAKADGVTESIRGPGPGLGIAIGGAVTDNLILFGQVRADLVPDPTVKSGSSSFQARGLVASVGGLGVGLAYYLMPSNVYVSAALMFSKISIDDDDASTDAVDLTDSGPGISMMLGKEWWVSDNWGLGVSGQVFLATMKGKDPVTLGGETPRWRAAAFSLAFSATYN